MSSFTVLIPKVVTKPTKLVDKKTGAFVEEQLVMIQHADLFTPVQASVLLDGGANPHQPGEYEMAGDSLQAGEYGRPQFRLRIGKPIKLAAGVAPLHKG